MTFVHRTDTHNGAVNWCFAKQQFFADVNKPLSAENGEGRFSGRKGQICKGMIADLIRIRGEGAQHLASGGIPEIAGFRQTQQMAVAGDQLIALIPVFGDAATGVEAHLQIDAGADLGAPALSRPITDGGGEIGGAITQEVPVVKVMDTYVQKTLAGGTGQTGFQEVDAGNKEFILHMGRGIDHLKLRNPE